MRNQGTELAAITGLAVLITLMIAAPVLRHPSERLFGNPIVGRHHDPFTVMAQFERPALSAAHLQPVTDVPGALLVRAWGPVAGYNWIVLLSFPLSAAAAYLLGRYLTLSRAASAFVALAYAFSPFHLAHAAYHVHIAQTQWLPLYLLALWRSLDEASPMRLGALALAALAVGLSSIYLGFVAAVLTPAALGAYWLVRPRSMWPPGLNAGAVAGTLLLMAAAGVTYAGQAAGESAALTFPRSDLFLYSARWWSYLVAPVASPAGGAAAHVLWLGAGVREGLVEQQVSLGLGIVVLGAIAVSRRVARDPGLPSVEWVPILAAVGVAALVCSLSPERSVFGLRTVRPSALLFGLAPMFRSYARFGVAVQLMAVLLAGIGAESLWRRGTRTSRAACAALVLLAAAEYAVAPWTLWRDVLPTAAHRWALGLPDPARVLDCTPRNQESASVEWLTARRVGLLEDGMGDCGEPGLPARLAASGYTHLLVRRHAPDEARFSGPRPPEGLRSVARFDDGEVFRVTGEAAPLYTGRMSGFYPRERSGEGSWRWMGEDAVWTVVNTTGRPLVAVLAVEMSAFNRSRRLEVLLDWRSPQALAVDPQRRRYTVGPLVVVPGEHALVFRPLEPPTVAGDERPAAGAPRALSFAIWDWAWAIEEGGP